MVANRTREIRPSGMKVGAYGNVNRKLKRKQPTRSSRVRRDVNESRPSSFQWKNCARRISIQTGPEGSKSHLPKA